MPQSRPILLYDIDGTLLNVKRDFLLSIIAEQLERFGVEKPDARPQSFAGRTDRGIFMELIGEREDGEEIFKRLTKSYMDAMNVNLTSMHVHQIEKAVESVRAAKNLDIPIGLCTGNFRSVAMKKVEAAGLNGFFSFGGFGGIHSDRNFLPGEAANEYQEIFGIKPESNSYVVIGDTPNDIRCAKYFGALSVAVTTGGFTAAQLEPHRPDLILDSLDNPRHWLSKLGFELS
ncbi:HAD family hydrolase [Rhodohalobacter sp. SW132]|nr:HAD hydrolase-like protein [Rhodohalobacter sp. SW132]